jgi:hypothetical protein
MKLTNLTTTLKNNAVKLLAVSALAAGALAATPAAQAQVHFGVFVGGPRYYRPAPPPAYYGYGYGYGRPNIYAYDRWHYDRFDHRFDRRWHR